MIETIHDHTVHPRYLGSQSHVLDLGANYGLFAKAVTARFGCRCIAVEPSPEPFAAIVETSLISKLQAAAASQSGTVPFHIAPDSVFSSLYRTSEVIRVIEVPAISFPDLFDLRDGTIMQLELPEKVIEKLATSDRITIVIECQPDGKMASRQPLGTARRWLMRDQLLEVRHATADGPVAYCPQGEAPRRLGTAMPWRHRRRL